MITASCSCKPGPAQLVEQREQQVRDTCESLAKEHNASLAWTKLIDPNHTSWFMGNPYTIEVQKALTATARIVCVGTLCDILQADAGYTIHLSYGHDFLDPGFPAFLVMFILTCSNEDANRLLSIPSRAGNPRVAFVAEVSTVKKVLFRAFADGSFEVDIEPGKAFVAYGRCLAFKEIE